MKTVKWLYNRLKKMSLGEILKFRIPQFIQGNIIGHIHKNKQFSIEGIRLNSGWNPPKYSVSKLKKLTRTFSYKYSFFQAEVNLKDAINWRFDYKNQICSPLAYYGKIRRQDYNTNGDVKYISEISRFHFLPFLALQQFVNKEANVNQQIEQILKDWKNQNPYLNSINWTSGIEIGIRSVNLVYTHLVLNQCGALGSNLDYLIKEILVKNYHFLKNHLSLYSSANNHLVAELLGLVIISNYFKGPDFETKIWNDFFFEELLKQVNMDGVNVELSTRYHIVITDHFLVGLEFIKRAGEKIPNAIHTRFKKMFDFVNHSYFNGLANNFGDDDNSHLIFPYYDTTYSIFNSLLQSFNYLFNTPYYGGDFDLRNLLIFGDDFKISNSETIKFTNMYFKESGYIFLYHKDLKISYDVGKIGDNLLSAHGHSDLLHFTVSKGTTNFIVDSGTYQYHSKKQKWRNYFKEIAAHNTISINGRNHSDTNGRMGWKENPEVQVLNYDILSETPFCLAQHDAFKNQGIRHQRKLELIKSKKKLVINDNLLYSKFGKSVNVTFYMHFHPNIKVFKEDDVIKLENIFGEKMFIRNNFFEQIRLLKGDKDKPLGWYSKLFDVKEPTYTLMANLNIKKNTTLITTIDYI